MRVVLNNAGSGLERYDYYPYGEKIDVSVASSGNTGKGNLGTQNGYYCPNSAILKLMGQKRLILSGNGAMTARFGQTGRTSTGSCRASG